MYPKGLMVEISTTEPVGKTQRTPQKMWGFLLKRFGWY